MFCVAGVTFTRIWISVDPDQLMLGLRSPVDGRGLTSLMLMFFTNCWAIFGLVSVNGPVFIAMVAVLHPGSLVSGMVSADVNVVFGGYVTPGRDPPLPG